MIARWDSKIDQLTADFNAEFGGLTADQLNWKPNPDTWSIAQNIDHLIIINRTYFPILSALREGKYKVPWIGSIGFIVSFLGKTVLKAVNPDRKKKMKTFPIWEPGVSTVSDAILSRFEQHQRELKHRIQTSEDFLDKNTVISSPGNRNIVYSLETAFDIIVTHEQRHLEQAKEVLAQMK